jgi:uncharacterized membrane protein YdjX (TVP38/TMEM64 family)
MTSNSLTFADLTRQLQTLLMGTWYGPLLYILVYLLRPLIVFPASLLTILGGSIFGLGWGFVVVLIAGTLSAALPYVVGRWFSRGGESQTKTHPRIQSFLDLLRRTPFQAVLIMRLIYLPYDAVSLLVGSLRIGFLPFIAATALGNTAGTLSFVGIGASIEGDLASGDLSLNPTILLFSGLILILSIVLSRMLKRRELTSDEG